MSGLWPWLGRIVAMTSAARRRDAIAQFAPLGLRMQARGLGGLVKYYEWASHLSVIPA